MKTMLWLTVVLSIAGLALCQTEEPSNLPPETIWDCSRDHRVNPDDRRKFDQSPNGFGEGAAVTTTTCPLLQEFIIMANGSCRCQYVPELLDILSQDCPARVLPGTPPEEYDQFQPTLEADSIDGLYVRKSCNALLQPSVVDWFRALNVLPIFFDQSECRCNWTAEGLENLGEALFAGAIPGDLCERLADQNFREGLLDEVGNAVDAFPADFNSSVSRRSGGTVFGGELRAVVSYSLQGVDFVDMNLMVGFDADTNAGQQIILSNVCLDEELGSGGTVQLMYNPAGRQFSLEFFGSSAQCTPAAPAGIQNVQIIYRDGAVSLLVNNVECDVSNLNPVAAATERLQFNSRCPFQVGGTVFTDIAQLSSGREVGRVGGLEGVIYRFMALRNCANPPRMVQDRLDGSV